MIPSKNKTGEARNDNDVIPVFRELHQQGVWSVGPEERMQLRIPTADALALAINPTSGFAEASIICYLLELRHCTDAGGEEDKREILTAIQQIKGRMRSPAMSADALSLIGWAQKSGGTR